MEKKQMWPNSWQNSLNQWLNSPPTERRLALVGIGNMFRSDDAAGSLIARALLNSAPLKHQKGLLVIDAGHAPENITADLNRFRPDRILFVDAADMGELPGSIHWIAMDEIEGMTASTHTLTISLLADYINLSLNCSSMLLGIQPLSNDFGNFTSPHVSAAINAIVQELTALSWSSAR